MLHDFDVVFDSLGGDTLDKSVEVLKPGGRLIGIAGPPDPHFAEERKLSWPLRLVMTLLSRGIRKKAERRGAEYSFHFMRASGEQLREIAALVDAGVLRPIVDRVFPFEETEEAMTYVDAGRAKGKVVVSMK